MMLVVCLPEDASTFVVQRGRESARYKHQFSYLPLIIDLSYLSSRIDIKRKTHCTLSTGNHGFAVFNAYEKVAPSWLRSRALEWVYAVLEKEDEFTNFIDIGPVNKVKRV